MQTISAPTDAASYLAILRAKHARRFSPELNSNYQAARCIQQLSIEPAIVYDTESRIVVDDGNYHAVCNVIVRKYVGAPIQKIWFEWPYEDFTFVQNRTMTVAVSDEVIYGFVYNGSLLIAEQQLAR